MRATLWSQVPPDKSHTRGPHLHADRLLLALQRSLLLPPVLQQVLQLMAYAVIKLDLLRMCLQAACQIITLLLPDRQREL